jgi:hypothetical protein
MAQHEPAARGGAQRRIVIDDDAVVAADAERHHRPSELRRRGQHVRRRVGMVGQRVDIEEDRARNVRGAIFVSAAASRGRHVPARIDDAQVRIAEVVGKPIRGNQAVHGARIAARGNGC